MKTTLITRTRYVTAAVWVSGLFLAACSADPTQDMTRSAGTICFEATERSDGATAQGFTASGVFTLQGEREADTLFLHSTLSDGIGSDNLVGTRAAPVTDMSAYGAFGVLGYVYAGAWSESLTPDYMYNVEVRSQSGVWAPSATYYWPGISKKIRFFAYAPYNASGVTLGARTAPGTPLLSYSVPAAVADQKDLLTARTNELAGNTDTAVPLLFEHALTAVKFVEGDNMLPGKITKITLKGVYGSGSYAIGGAAWSNYGAVGNFSQTLDQTVGRGAGDAITQPAQTFMMLPQTLPAGATVEVVFTDLLSSTQRTLSASIGGSVWPQGKTVTYRISTTSISVTATLTVTEPGNFTYAGGSQNFTITSSALVVRPGDQNVTVSAAWTADFSTDGGTTWSATKPDWLTTFTTSGSGSVLVSTFPVTVAAQGGATGNTHNDVLRAASPVSGTYALATNGGTTSMNTANCYTVNAPGVYSLPLVYGNAVKNGAANSAAYTSTATGLSVLKTFVNHRGAAITDPYIYNNANCTPVDAVLVWQDEPGLVTGVALDAAKQNITFTVAQSTIKQGNAVVAVRGAGNQIMWSWHIWVTDYKPGNDLKIVTNYQNFKYTFLPVNIGWCDPEKTTYAGRSVLVRIRQTLTNALQTFTVRQLPMTISNSGNNLYFQWGRKDPMLGGIRTSGGTSVDKTGYSGVYTFNKGGVGPVTLNTAILNPHIFYLNTVNADWCLTNYANTWNANNTATGGNDNAIVKTIYDPSPAGYCVPPSNAWTGSTWTGTTLGDVNGYGKQFNSPYRSEAEYLADFGLTLYCNKMTAESTFDPAGGTIFYPATGYRKNANGVVELAGQQSVWWSAVPASTTGLSCYGGCASLIIAPYGEISRAFGFSVRSVKE